MNQEAQTIESPATEAPAKVVTPRAPKLVATIAGVDHPLLKYAFPVKAAKYNVKVNGVDVATATTGGRGKFYTYFLINNTSFYVAGVVPADTEMTVNFPDGYKFDDSVADRKSYYKPKAKAAAAEAGETEAQAKAEDPGHAVAEAILPEADAPKGKRRGR